MNETSIVTMSTCAGTSVSSGPGRSRLRERQRALQCAAASAAGRGRHRARCHRSAAPAAAGLPVNAGRGADVRAVCPRCPRRSPVEGMRQPWTPPRLTVRMIRRRDHDGRASGYGGRLLSIPPSRTPVPPPAHRYFLGRISVLRHRKADLVVDPRANRGSRRPPFSYSFLPPAQL